MGVDVRSVDMLVELLEGGSSKRGWQQEGNVGGESGSGLWRLVANCMETGK